MSARPLVEILAFGGCPNAEPARELAQAAAAAVGVEAEIRVVDVPDVAAAERERFLGSPTIRVDGRDVEPGAEARTDHVFSCRVYRTDAGLAGLPDAAWLRAALARAS
jgi:hypothetical protein